MAQFTAPSVVRSQSIGDIPRRTAVRYPDALAIIDGDTKITYQQLDVLCDNVAASAQAAGSARARSSW
ncbi:hypothetical protein ET495_11640 [Xylanimonas allomyrinae]|uniref:AMP-dependent synthetase/ligase domain-containing protein n=1 Tax=Xylanimonas allomyrinae TaxID=2509459 RepID=A0A4P6EMW2_9MICO|nr:hypothetical protein [Xylanimonas allomyrinae]QAY63785.1 hypothetical protein ET495_11640 [Xylanimonas allomyrinae]